MLTLAGVPGYLLDCGLLDEQSMVDVDLVVRELSGRNRAFGAYRRDACGHLLKQDSDLETGTVAHEARVYRLLAGEPRLRGHLPRFHGYDAAERVLLAEFLPDAVDLNVYHARRRKPSAFVAASIGRLLAWLHRMPMARWDGLDPPMHGPMFLSPHRPSLEFYRTASRGMLELVRIVQATPGFAERLDEVAAAWSRTAPIHRDIRWSNLLLTGDRGGRPRLVVVDWELAGPGDSRWDIGSALAAYLTLWIGSIPVSAADDPVSLPGLAARPLEGVQRAIRVCWRTYAAGIGLADGVADRMLAATVPFVAARLVHTALESAQSSAQPDITQVLQLQVASNMLERPRDAVVYLLGLEPGGGG
ncbi:phosphotransferase family protein [Phytohabitans sp. LJ34]|uniref:phosphotransferase family protein n=1 Tax=Phytohabitans sp. LJ34 TaxID=3452217 RepID=UPI003F8A7529